MYYLVVALFQVRALLFSPLTHHQDLTFTIHGGLHGKRKRDAEIDDTDVDDTAVTKRITRSQSRAFKLESLPTELIQHVLKVLDPADFLRIKFTSKNLNNLAKDGNGDDLVHVDHTPINKYQHCQAIIGVEKEMLWRRKRPGMLLTCAFCYKLKTVGLEGFSDDQMNPAQKRRMCIPCGKYYFTGRPFKVNGTEMAVCVSCYNVAAADASNMLKSKSGNHRVCRPCFDDSTKFVRRELFHG